jgi:hypothetical protein
MNKERKNLKDKTTSQKNALNHVNEDIRHIRYSKNSLRVVMRVLSKESTQIINFNQSCHITTPGFRNTVRDLGKSVQEYTCQVVDMKK